MRLSEHRTMTLLERAIIVALCVGVAALIGGCTTLPVYTATPGDSSKPIAQIEETWSLDVEEVDSPDCAIVLHLTDPPSGVECADRAVDGCSNGLDVWCPPDSRGPICAHEVGHSAGLKHVEEEDDPNRGDRVMSPIIGADNTRIIPKEQRAVRVLSTTLSACRKARR